MDKTKIDYIKFGIMSEKEITQLSVLKICSTKLNGPNSLYDERLGTMDNNKNCITCGLNNKLCPGHFGHIELNVDIKHLSFCSGFTPAGLINIFSDPNSTLNSLESKIDPSFGFAINSSTSSQSILVFSNEATKGDINISSINIFTIDSLSWADQINNELPDLSLGLS